MMNPPSRPLILKNAKVDEYEQQEQRQLVPVDGLTEIETIQQGVGHTDIPETPAGQGTLSTAADGGTDTTPNNDNSRESEQEAAENEQTEISSRSPYTTDVSVASAVPADAEWLQVDAQRLRELLEAPDTDDILAKGDFVQRATHAYDMDPERVVAALKKARSELEVISEVADGYTAA